jgi:hypothetical protein
MPPVGEKVLRGAGRAAQLSFRLRDVFLSRVFY